MNKSKPMARIGDRTLGTCYHPSHDEPLKNIGGQIITGSNNVYTDSKMVARIADLVLSDCGHVGTIITADEFVYGNERSAARLDDITTGDYVCNIITGSNTTYL